jgi:succinate dehydrogenase / fumarate reductase cytochrome b subunit
MAERPLSPHVTVYKWAYTMTLSILHRVTGVALFLALIGLIAWLMAAAAGPGAYAQAMTTLSSLPAKCLIAIAVLALCYHFCNGLRHLAWDMGLGFERAQARRSALIVIVVALLAAAVCLYWLFGAGGAA